jgi:hypothetical protein
VRITADQVPFWREVARAQDDAAEAFEAAIDDLCATRSQSFAELRLKANAARTISEDVSASVASDTLQDPR